MQNKNHISEAISSYYFHQTLPRTNSLSTYQSLDKQNIPHVRNQSIHQKQIRPSTTCIQPLQQSSSNMNYAFQQKTVICHQPFHKASSPRSIIQSYSSVKDLLKNKRSESSAYQKKSVKFIDKPEVIVQPQLRRISNRARSNSILKSRSLSKDYNQKRQTLKMAQSSNCIWDYKNVKIKQKYNQILNGLGRQVKFRVTSSVNMQGSIPYNPLKCHNKFIDSSFPPLHSSLSKIKHFQSISWKRISEMNSFQQVVRRKPGQMSSMKLKWQREECKIFAFMLNLIKDSSKMLDFLFEDLKFNQKGAYIIKIFQQNQWKYIIIDDYIPVLEKSGSYKPAFLSIEGNHKSQIWPLLLQKAYAAYLGSYDGLYQLSLPFLLTDLLRLPVQIYMADENSINQLTNSSINKLEDFLFYGEKKNSTEGSPIYRILKVQKDKQRLEFLEQNEDHTFTKIAQTDFINNYKEFFKVFIPNFQFFSSSDVVGANTIGRQIKSKYFSGFNSSSEISYQQIVSKISVRSFTVSKMDEYSLIIKTYDQNCKRKHNSWSRVLLFQKQLDSFRWIAGKYSNQIISFTYNLEAGLYYLILIPDCSQESIPNFVITSYGKFSSISFYVQSDLCAAAIIEKGCTDFAQRIGKMTQINKWICTYTLINAEAGIIIQNVNNERRNGSIKILRTIKNLKAKNCFIAPLNKEFYSPNNGKSKQEAQLTIQKQESASVVLFFFRGFDSQFFKNFNFGL